MAPSPQLFGRYSGHRPLLRPPLRLAGTLAVLAATPATFKVRVSGLLLLPHCYPRRLGLLPPTLYRTATRGGRGYRPLPFGRNTGHRLLLRPTSLLAGTLATSATTPAILTPGQNSGQPDRFSGQPLSWPELWSLRPLLRPPSLLAGILATDHYSGQPLPPGQYSGHKPVSRPSSHSRPLFWPSWPVLRPPLLMLAPRGYPPPTYYPRRLWLLPLPFGRNSGHRLLLRPPFTLGRFSGHLGHYSGRPLSSGRNSGRPGRYSGRPLSWPELWSLRPVLRPSSLPAAILAVLAGSLAGPFSFVTYHAPKSTLSAPPFFL